MEVLQAPGPVEGVVDAGMVLQVGGQVLLLQAPQLVFGSVHRTGLDGHHGQGGAEGLGGELGVQERAVAAHTGPHHGHTGGVDGQLPHQPADLPPHSPDGIVDHGGRVAGIVRRETVVLVDVTIPERVDHAILER